MQNNQLNKLFRNLRAGQCVYVVHALGAQSFLTQYFVKDKPSYNKAVSDFKVFAMYSGFRDGFFAGDMNCYTKPNGYNFHKAFLSKKKAQKYLADCIRDDISLPRNFSDWDDYFGCDDRDDCDYDLDDGCVYDD